MASPVAQADTVASVGRHHHHGNPSPAVQGPRPTITGEATLGATLTADAGEWTPAGVTLTYQWYRGHREVTDATGTTYLLTDSDVGRRITVRVTGSADGYRSGSRFAKPTDRVSAPSLTSVVPVITGTAQVGATLTADAGVWAPDGVTLSYQWYRSGHRIRNATAASYTLVVKDWRHRISVKVSGTLDGYAPTVAVSERTAKVIAGVLTSTPVPIITGDPTVGQVLTAVAGTWGPGKVHLRYQWYRSGEKIEGARHSEYLVSSADEGATLTVVVTGWKCGYLPVAEVSAPTAIVTVTVG
jgi:hypothetical protein